MLFKEKQKVKINSLEWYTKNKNYNGDVITKNGFFSESMSSYCGKVATIKALNKNNYVLDIDAGTFVWCDDMLDYYQEVDRNITVGGKYNLIDNINSIGELEDLIERKKPIAIKNDKNKYELKPSDYFYNWSYIKMRIELPHLFKVKKKNKLNSIISTLVAEKLIKCDNIEKVIDRMNELLKEKSSNIQDDEKE